MSDLLRKAGQRPIVQNPDPSGILTSRTTGQRIEFHLQVGFGGLVPDAKCPKGPSNDALSSAELREIAGVGGAGLSGTGTLSGRIELVTKGVVEFGIATLKEVPVLVTANYDRPDKVSFDLDLRPGQAKALAGQDVAVSGLIEKTTDNAGKITGAKLEATDGYPFGTWKSLTGKIENVPGLMGIGGETAPGGSYLNLDQPIIMGGQEVHRVFVQGKELTDGARVELTGRLDQAHWGGVERPRVDYVALSGVTDQTAGEPRFDGEKFYDARGKELQTMSYDVPNMYDGPSTLYVLDQGSDKAWIGVQAVFIPPEMNPFMGFREARAIEYPTTADRDAIGPNDYGHLVDRRSGEELELLAERGQGPDIADGMTTGWYRHPGNGDIYRFQNGGIAGFSNYMDQIVRAPRSAPGPFPIPPL